MSRISYYKEKGEHVVKQELGSFSLYTIDGELEDALKAFTREVDGYREYITKEHELHGEYKLPEGVELPAPKPFSFSQPTFSLKFDRVEFSVERDYDGDQHMVVFGYRKPFDLELQVLEKEEAASKAEFELRERKKFEELKAKFGG